MRKLPSPPRMPKLKGIATYKPGACEQSRPIKKSPILPTRPSSIETHSYDPELKQLLITFSSGARYRYYDIEPDLYAEFEAADSRGRFLHGRIINKFPALKIDLDG